jgi:hypothetical protein
VSTLSPFLANTQKLKGQQIPKISQHCVQHILSIPVIHVLFSHPDLQEAIAAIVSLSSQVDAVPTKKLSKSLLQLSII